MGLFGPPDIDSMKQFREVNGLIKALKYSKNHKKKEAWEVRRDAAKALGDLFQNYSPLHAEGQYVEECLVLTLKDQHPDVRAAAATALERMRLLAGFVFEPLRTALKDENLYVRQAAAGALSKGIVYGGGVDESNWSAVLDALNDCDSGVHRHVAEALLRSEVPDWGRLNAALAHDNWRVRQWAAETIGKLPIKRLSRFSNPNQLVSALRDKSPEVRAAAAAALGKVGDLNIMDRLISLLKSEADEHVRRAVSGAVKEIGSPELEFIIRELEQNSTSYVRRSFAEYLGFIGDSRAEGPLVAALKDSDEGVRKAAASALDEIAKKDARYRPVVDLRGDKERRIEVDASAGESLGPEIDDLVTELIEIGSADGFRSTAAGGKFNQNCDHIRVREIGNLLNELGGMDLMQVVYYRVRSELPGEARSLEGAWGYIGEWRP